jgi:hypothetical protein
VGQLGYWSPSRALAVVYAVDGEGSIPGPGLILLGTVDAGLETIADGGDSFAPDRADRLNAESPAHGTGPGSLGH